MRLPIRFVKAMRRAAGRPLRPLFSDRHRCAPGSNDKIHTSSARRWTTETSLAHRSWGSSQPVSSYLIGALHLPNGHSRRIEADFQERLKIGDPARTAAKDIQAERFVLREGVTGDVRFAQQADAGHPERIRELVPRRFAEWMKIQFPDDELKQLFQAILIDQRRGVAAVRLDNPLQAGHVLSFPSIAERYRTPGRIWTRAESCFRSWC